MTRASVLALGIFVAGCYTLPLGLENPMYYRSFPPESRLTVPCYFALDDETRSTVLEDDVFRLELGPAVVAQLRSALGEVCTRARHLTDPEEFPSLLADEPALLLEVGVAGKLRLLGLTGASNRANFDGTARISGRSLGWSPQLAFSGAAERRQDPFSPPVGGDVIRDAMRAAIQDLANKVAGECEQLERIARGDAPETPEGEAIDQPKASP